MKVQIKAKTNMITDDTVYLEFGPTQAEFSFSSTGVAARKLRLKEGDKVLVTIEKV
jgi:translation initiation factor IF-1